MRESNKNIPAAKLFLKKFQRIRKQKILQSCKTWKNFAPRAAKKSRKLLRAPHEFPPQISGGKSWAKRGFCRQTRPMRAKRCNPATRDKPARLKWREKPPPPARNRRSKAKGNLRIHFNPARGISRAFRNNLPRKRLKKSLRYARLCREARRNPAGAPTRGQQHLQMPFRNPDFQRRRPFPQTFPHGQTETADSPAPIRRKPAIKHKKQAKPPRNFRAITESRPRVFERNLAF